MGILFFQPNIERTDFFVMFYIILFIMKKETSSIFKKQQIYTVEVTNNDNTLFRKTSLHISPKATIE